MPQIRYFQTESQRAQLADILASAGKQRGQPPVNGQDWVFDRLTEAAVQGSIGVNSVVDEGRITLTNGQTQKITKEELEAFGIVSDPKWKPERPEAKLKIIQVSENSKLYTALLKSAALENVVARKISGITKHPCLESYIDNVLNSHLRTDTAQILLKDLQEEKRATFAEKKEEAEKPAKKGEKQPAA